ncbi:DUF2637 domain-containing protein [Arthrobacter sp. A2-55]|uniref:DUF2637 domain-containing protein n=1 Tax=Arthrobacter sp. A2-55 TaxID=2897337 RepID=UPI0021CDCE7D|nr:DUF2637 domain-containing protein [Arthrobacter sp. A2-55]MCU6480188.1 DUF2637 domain-containing protein [Arthrobacter sp. A2-55]
MMGSAHMADMTKNANPLGRPIVLTGFAATVVIAVGAFILSFASLTDLAGRSGIDRSLAWIWPIIVDGLIVAATVAIVALSGHDRKTLAYPWTLLFFGAVVSTAANAVHAILSVDQIHGTVPPIVSAVVASMPPVVLLAITHLTVVLVQKSAGKPGRKVTVPRRAVKPVPATRLVVAPAPGHDPVAAPSHGLDHPQPVAV